MAYVPVPKDLSKVKTKVAFNLTKRQLLCLGAALLVGLPLFFLLKDSAGTTVAAFIMILVMLPCFLFAMYEKHGQPLEVLVKHIIQTKFVRPKERPYRTENFYAVLQRQRTLEKEVSEIVKRTYQKNEGSGRKQTKVDPRRKETD
ncbi:PrgI family protein [Clostridioides difficile]|nr:PrgI family protein [Clostridioides difficile]